MVLAVTSGIRAVTPVGITPVFAIGVKYQILGGYLVWVVLVGAAVGFTVLMYTAFPKEAEGRILGREREREREDGEDGS